MDNKTKELEDFKTSLPEIDGITTINHRARIELGLNCSEFVLMNFVAGTVELKHKYDWIQAYRKTGFTKDNQALLLKKLVEKGFIFPEQVDPPKLSDKWYSAFTDLEKEFNQFWKGPDGQNAWHGSKPKAFEWFRKRRKEGSTLTYLMNQRDHYFEFLRYCSLNNFNRQKMMATVFLGEQKRYEEDWKVQLNEQKAIFDKNRTRLEESKDIKPLSEQEFKDAMNK